MRIGLLGTGPWARIAHAPALHQHQDLEFVGVWGRRPEAAGALAAEFGVRPYEDLDRLLDEVDAVAVALPPRIQADLAERAAAAGCHLLLDKPLALGVPDSRRVVDACEAAGVASVVFFTLRFIEECEAWVTEQAAAGGWFTARTTYVSSVFSGESEFADSPWRREKGALWDLGPHALSVLLPVLGDAEEVTAARGPRDTTHLTVRHSGGALSSSMLSLTAPPAASSPIEFEFRGESGVTTMPEGLRDPVAALRRAADALIEAAGTGRPHPCDASFGLRVVQVLAEAERRLAARVEEEEAENWTL
ncbi:oxidoreductase [Wenjunlia vitaminophila]|uniref:Oxidoreductase n=1 Tax=Wenjunlia vitaminophila TaxID=76728 RepID=A0A0T6LKY1_WENVI|nr:Gfo/Idh/MocA family oxidoreductase [Wenjunlia vitaminophila]KRV46714.1 oxidoreductase [Wenjunlia vitaminophila]